MKKLILLFLIPFFFITGNLVQAETIIPDKPINGIYDPNHYLSENTSVELEKENANSDIQIGIYIVDTLEGKSIEEEANEVARNWKIGHSDTNKGALIAIAINDRKFRIETSNELNTTLTDSKAKSILDNSKSYMRNKDYDGAIINIIQQIKNIENKNSLNNETEILKINEDGSVVKSGKITEFVATLLMGLFLFVVLAVSGLSVSLYDKYEKWSNLKKDKKFSEYDYNGPKKLYPNNPNWINNPSWTEERINEFYKENYTERSQYNYINASKKRYNRKLYPGMKNFIPNESWTEERIETYKNKVAEENRIKEEKLKKEREERLKRSRYNYKGRDKLYPKDYGFIENETWTAILTKEYLDNSYYNSSSSSHNYSSSSYSSSSDWGGGGFDGGGASGSW
jgi:hypothetical protein